MAKILDPQAVQRMLFEAARDGERKVTGFIGRNDTDLNIYEGLPAGYVWVRIAEQPDPYAAFYTDPASVVLNAPVELDFDVESDAWVVKSIAPSAASYAVTSGGGSSFPFAVPTHDHTDASEGGSLGNNTVDTSQLVNAAVETAKIADEAVTLPKIVRLGDGSLFVGNGAGVDVSELTAGTEGQVLTITSGVPAWEDASSITTPVSVADGGTGRTSVTANSLLIGNGTSALSLLTPSLTDSIPNYKSSVWAMTRFPTIGSGMYVNTTQNASGDFRTSSVNNLNLLFGDASADAIGINTSSPDANSAVTITPDSGDAPLQMTPAATPTNLSNGQVWQDSDHNALGIRSAGYTGWASEVKYKMYGTASVTSTSYTSVTTGSSVGTTTIPANYLVPGKFCTMHLRGVIVGGSSLDTVDFQSTIQSTGTLTLTAFGISSSTTYYFDWWIEFWCVTTGASNTIRDHMRVDMVESGLKSPAIAMTRNTTLPSVNTASAATLAPVVKRNTAVNGCTIVVTAIDMKLY